MRESQSSRKIFLSVTRARHVDLEGSVDVDTPPVGREVDEGAEKEGFSDISQQVLVVHGSVVEESVSRNLVPHILLNLSLVPGALILFNLLSQRASQRSSTVGRLEVPRINQEALICN